MKVNKAQAIETATGYGLAIYRNDTLATIVTRINKHVAAQNELLSGIRREKAAFEALATRRYFTLRGPRQLMLGLSLPRDFSIASGTCA